MPRNNKNLLIHELIGLKAEVKESSDKEKIGISGKVKDETRNMIRIEDKWIPKEETSFLFTIKKNQEVLIKGKNIRKRPEDRLDL